MIAEGLVVLKASTAAGTFALRFLPTPTIRCDCSGRNFRPGATIIPFETEAEAIEIANDTPYGLAAYVQTGDADRAARLSRALRAGAVHFNRWCLRIRLALRRLQGLGQWSRGWRDGSRGLPRDQDGAWSTLELSKASIGGLPVVVGNVSRHGAVGVSMVTVVPVAVVSAGT